MAERRPEAPQDPQASTRRGGGYQGGGPSYGRGYGGDFGGGGRDQGFDGSWGQGYGGSVAPSDYRQGFGGEADDRSWIDRCADDECQGRRRHRGRGPKDWSRDDQRLYEEVCERLLHDRLIDARGIEVEVEDGVVTLRGEARAAADPMLVERLVRDTPGVRAVEMGLAVRPGPHRAPEPPAADDPVDKSSLAVPLVPGRAPPPDAAGAP